MRKKRSFVFLFLYILAACTILSGRIEEIMTTKVITYKMDAIFESEIPASALFAEQSGSHLYYLKDGLGWQSGKIVQEFEDDLYSVSDDGQTVSVSLFFDWEVVLSASRKPQIGQKVDILSKRNTIDDRFLILGSEGVSIDKSATIQYDRIASNDTAALLYVHDVCTPLLEHEVKGMLFQMPDSSQKIYSISEVENLIKSLPFIAAASVLLLIPLFMLLLNCFVETRYASISMHAVSGAMALVSTIPILNQIQIAPSLVPSDQIFDLQFYAHEISQVVNALVALGDNTLLLLLKQMQVVSVVIALFGALLLAILICACFVHRVATHG